MNNLSKIFLLSLSALAASLKVSAQGDEALPFVAIDRNPVTSAMGGVSIASSSVSPFSAFSNSALIPLSHKTADFAFSWQNWAPDGTKSTNFNLGGVYKIGKKIGLSVAGTYQSGDEYTVIDASGNAKDPFTPSDMVFGVGVGYNFFKGLSAGVNLKYASEKLSDEDTYSAFGADIFLAYRISDFNLTAGVTSVGSSVKDYKGNSFSLPSSAKLGVGYDKVFSEKHLVEAGLEGDYYFSGNPAVALGAGYTFNEMLSVRAGYRYGGDSVIPSYASAGIGFSMFGVHIDLSYLFASEVLGNTMNIGLGWRF